ncbi:MAG: hypothetical protein JWN06_114, partial [Propionibacteriaceae bacterium]|nr:hypothetical protein [Propionibacteriaceae bacterium]
LTTGARYTVTHPYGVNVFTAAAGRINQTIDAGICAPTAARPCDWAGVGEAFLGDAASTTTSTFLKQTGAAPGTLGDINTARTVTGAPTGNNFVRVDGPNVGGAGINTVTISQFTVQGLIFNGADAAPSTPDLAAASDSGKSATDNITNVMTPTLAGTVPGLGTNEATVELTEGTSVIGSDSTLGGAYSIAPSVALAPGVHRIQARTPNPAYGLDEFGNPLDPTIPQYLTSGTLTFTVDTAAPVAGILAPRPSNPSADTTPTLNFNSAEAGASFECQLLPSNADWDNTCASPMVYDQQLTGNYTFNVRATDVAGNTGAPATFSWRIGEPDTVAPTLSAQTPTVNATNVPLANTITATFSEAVTGVSGTSFVLTDPAGAVVPATVTYDAATRRATLDPTNPLLSSTKYTVSLKNTISDISNNLYAGTTWSFTSADTTPPGLTARTPGVDATGASATGNITATFSEPVTGVSGTTFQLTNAAGTAVAATVSYNATTRVATLDPTATLAANTTYTARLTGASIVDSASNSLADTTWSFTTAAAPVATAPGAPTIGAPTAGNASATVRWTAPASNGGSAITGYQVRIFVGAATTATRTVTVGNVTSSVVDALTNGTGYQFDVAAINAVGTGAASARTATTTPVAPPPSVTVAGAPTIGAPTAANASATVRWTAPASNGGAAITGYRIRTYVGTSTTVFRTTNVANVTSTSIGTLTNGTGYQFDVAAINSAGTGTASARTATTTPRTEFVAPTITTRAPASGGTAVAVGSNITATFGEAVTGVSGTTFVLRNAAGTAVAAAVTYDATTRVATLNPTANLPAEARYTATLTGGAAAIRDTAGNPLATSSWSFVVGTRPTLTTRSPAVNAIAVSRTANVTGTFSEAVQGVSGTSVTLKNATTGAAISAVVSYNATTRVVTLNPSATLAANTKFTVTMTGSATAIRDMAGNNFGNTTWSFTTGA